ncbi:MAG: TetR-like C-terminal domain-containing protein [Pseudomonadota bacterium]|nr:TetR-like C-terminal domain-containing protein [Pseudomonadota bacterium]
MTDARRIHDALIAGELGREHLTARGLGTFLGATTSRVYTHHGSLDGLLFAVAGEGFRGLATHLAAALRGGLPDVAEAYVAWGLDHPVLYELMFVRPYDWAALRAAGVATEGPGVALWKALRGELAAAGSTDPAADARVLYAGVHGLVSLAVGGRANIGQLDISDRDAALAAARRLATRLCPLQESP